MGAVGQPVPDRILVLGLIAVRNGAGGEFLLFEFAAWNDAWMTKSLPLDFAIAARRINSAGHVANMNLVSVGNA